MLLFFGLMMISLLDHFHGRKLLKGGLSRAADADPTAAIARNPDNDNVDLASQVDVVKMTWAAWVFIALFTTLALGAWQWLSG